MSVYYTEYKQCALYTYNSIIAGPDKEEIDQITEDLNRAKYILTIEGDLQGFPVVNKERQGYVTINLTRPHLIDQIVNYLHLPAKR